MSNRFLRRCWDESRGDQFDRWGLSIWYFEVDEDGSVVRQIEVYDNGPTLRYGPGNAEDLYGGLAQESLNNLDEEWSPHTITQDTFERVWEIAAIRPIIDD